MTDADLKERELALAEQRLAFERERLEFERVGKKKGGGLTSLGAGLLAGIISIAGVFLDVQQANQQNFSARMTNLTQGYDFYFSQRDKLKASGDAGDLDAVIDTMTKAFPEAYCGIRPDLHRLAKTKGASEEENAQLVARILSTGELRRAGDPASSLLGRMPFPNKEEALAVECAPLTETGGETVEAKSEADPKPQETPAPEAATDLAASEPGEPAEEGAAAPQPSARAQTRDLVAPSVAAPSGRRAALAAARQPYRVFLQVGSGRRRDVLAGEREFLSGKGYRIAVGVERVGFAVKRAEVRYYRETQKADAEALAAWLTTYFKSEGLVFTAAAPRRRGLPDGILDVWIPDTRTEARVEARPSTLASPSP